MKILKHEDVPTDHYALSALMESLDSLEGVELTLIERARALRDLMLSRGYWIAPWTYTPEMQKALPRGQRLCALASHAECSFAIPALGPRRLPLIQGERGVKAATPKSDPVQFVLPRDIHDLNDLARRIGSSARFRLGMHTEDYNWEMARIKHDYAVWEKANG